MKVSSALFQLAGIHQEYVYDIIQLNFLQHELEDELQEI